MLDQTNNLENLLVMKINKITILLSLTISILFAYCSPSEQKKANSLPTFDLTDLSKTSIVKLSDLNVKDIDYIPLETSNTSLIKHTGKIIVSDSDIYVENYLMAILRFAKDGKLKNHIGKQGRGPGEFNNTIDFAVDSLLGQVFILNGNRSNPKINVYTLSGDFIESFLIPKHIRHIARLNDMILGYRTNTKGIIDSSFVLINYSGHTIKEFPNRLPFNEVEVPRGFLNEILQYNYNKKLYTKELCSDTVFVFENLNFKPAYILDFGKKLLSPEVRGGMNSFEDLIQVSTQYCITRNLFETNKFIYTDFSCEEHHYAFISYKNKKECLLLNMDKGIENDIDGGPNIWLKTAQDDSTIICWINAFELKQYVHSDEFKNSAPKYPEKKKELEQLANSLNENDNPVLILVKLKE